MQEVFIAVAIPVGLGWVAWVSRGVVRSTAVQEKVESISNGLDRVESKLDRLIERFL